MFTIRDEGGNVPRASGLREIEVGNRLRGGIFLLGKTRSAAGLGPVVYAMRITSP
jgi:hypothetical protein